MEQAETDKSEKEVKEPPPEERVETPPADGGPAHAVPAQEHDLLLPGKGVRKSAHYGLDIQFEDPSEDPELRRLVESTVWVNRSHPAYRRALASRSNGMPTSMAAWSSTARTWSMVTPIFPGCSSATVLKFTINSS